jgi:hypothetical protein
MTVDELDNEVFLDDADEDDEDDTLVPTTDATEDKADDGTDKTAATAATALPATGATTGDDSIPATAAIPEPPTKEELAKAQIAEAKSETKNIMKNAAKAKKLATAKA